MNEFPVPVEEFSLFHRAVTAAVVRVTAVNETPGVAMVTPFPKQL